MEPLELAKTVALALNSKKAKDIRLLKVRDLTVLADYFVIASGTSTTQVGALAEEVDYQLGKLGIEPLRVEGKSSRKWILLDYGSVVVHVFYPEARDFYSLEHMWADAEAQDLAFLEEAE